MNGAETLVQTLLASGVRICCANPGTSEMHFVAALDRHPELRDMIFGNYEALVYLAQTEDPALDSEAERCAQRLGLRYERRFTGYGDLSAALATLDRN